MIAQAIFKVGNKKVSRDALVRHALKVWRLNHKDYQSLPTDYQMLLEEKRQRKMVLGSLSPAAVGNYPIIKLLEFETEDEVLEYLDSLSASKIERMLDNVEYTLETDYTFVGMKNWVREANYLLYHLRKTTSSTKSAMGECPGALTHIVRGIPHSMTL